MTRFRFSIRARLTLFILAFVAIILALAVSGVLSLRAVDLKTNEIDKKWLAASMVLAEIADRISEYRIAEGYRALALGAGARADAELLANSHRREIKILENTYVALTGDQTRNLDLKLFRSSWSAYQKEHDAWVQSEARGISVDLERHNQSLQWLYKATDLAIDRLVAGNKYAADRQARSVDQLSDKSIVFSGAVATISLLLAISLLSRVRSQITQPLEAITQALSKLAEGSREIRVPEVHRDDEIGSMAKAFEIFRSNALALDQAHEATRLAQEQAHSLARHDALTGLPNRRVFSADLQAVLASVQGGAAPYAVLLVGLDQFKKVNELQGHEVGDLVLCEVARRLQETVGKDGTVARLGGDEFAIIAAGHTTHHAHLERAQDLARRLLVAIRAPIVVGHSTAEISASIGIAPCLADSTDAGNLLHAADIAMYRAKRDGGGSFGLFEQSMDDDLRAQTSLEADLKKAVAEGHIKPFYQPLVEIQSNRICGFEALARWNHPQRGFVPPDLFIPLIEQLGLMPQFTSSILGQACRDANQWADDVRLSVNISPSELKNPFLPSRLLAILAQQGFVPSRLDVEITETALVSNIETAKSVIRILQSSGIKVCLDDFGTGYSSLYHLRELKFDKVKIDRSFVQSMRNDTESEKIVDAILSLTKNLNLPTVAEGVEDPAVLLRLAAKGCEFGQGYYFGRAVSAEHAKHMVAERTMIQKKLTDGQQAA